MLTDYSSTNCVPVQCKMKEKRSVILNIVSKQKRKGTTWNKKKHMRYDGCLNDCSTAYGIIIVVCITHPSLTILVYTPLLSSIPIPSSFLFLYLPSPLLHLWLPETFSTPLQPLNGIQRNSTGSKHPIPSTKLVFSGRFANKDGRPG